MIWYRPYREEDRLSCINLYNYIYPKEISGENWAWRNEKNPAGKAFIETAWDGDRLVGFCSILPRVMLCKGRVVPAALSDIAVTHPRYRYRGIFTRLCDRVYRRVSGEGIDFIYGFPSGHSRHGFENKLGWYVCKGRELYRWGGSAGPEKGIVVMLERDGNQNEQIWESLMGKNWGNVIMAERSAGYIKWRFFDRPGGDCKVFAGVLGTGPGGYMVLERGAGGGGIYCDVVDIVAESVSCFRTMIEFAGNFFEDAQCTRIRIPPNSPYYHCARAMGFKEGGAVFYFGIKQFGGEAVSPDDWYYTMADSI
ncbi:MAG: GNAT family N-acetyltransferase [Bacillota bacterium]